MRKSQLNAVSACALVAEVFDYTNSVSAKVLADFFKCSTRAAFYIFSKYNTGKLKKLKRAYAQAAAERMGRPLSEVNKACVAEDRTGIFQPINFNLSWTETRRRATLISFAVSSELYAYSALRADSALITDREGHPSDIRILVDFPAKMSIEFILREDAVSLFINDKFEFAGNIREENINIITSKCHQAKNASL